MQQSGNSGNTPVDFNNLTLAKFDVMMRARGWTADEAQVPLRYDSVALACNYHFSAILILLLGSDSHTCVMKIH